MDAMEGDIWQRYEQVCSELNLDQESMDAAWSSYKVINNDYVLEGDHLEWLGCALYVAGQSSTLETVEGGQSSGNNVSLTQILRATKLNLIEFFKKIKKWLEMVKLSQSFLQRIESLERKFEVASIIFEKYRKLFCDMFRFPDEKQVPERQQRRGRKSNKSRPCTPFEVFKFGWTLYIHIKSQYPQVNDDLVPSYHLLLCCLDMLYGSSLMGKQKDLLNPDCPFVPEDVSSVDYTPPTDLPSILLPLCSKYGAIEKECRVIRDYYWRGPVKRMFDMQILTGSPRHTSTVDEAIAHMLTPANFYHNEKTLNKEYELNMLQTGDFDERVFLHQNADDAIGTPTRALAGSRLVPQTPPHHVQYGTPLMGREYLGAKDDKLTPVSDATQSVAHLHVLLDNCTSEPSDYLRKIASSGVSNPLPEIEERVQKFSEKFLGDFPVESQSSPTGFASLRLHMVVSLYYKMLDAIIKDEEKKHHNVGQLQTMLEYELFHKALFTLCAEIVLFSYNSQSRVFPWVLDAFEISAYHFYKLIEVVIKVQGSFPRGIIKHLNRVEEMVLSQLAWRSDSPLFEAIDAAGSVPSYEDVCLPTPTGGRGGASPLLHPRLKSLGAKAESPLSSLLTRDRVTSPSSARRQLFSPGSQGQRRTPTKHPVPIAPKPPQGSGGGGGVTITPINQKILNTAIQLQYLQNQQVQINQQLQTAQSSPPSSSAASSPSKEAQTQTQSFAGSHPETAAAATMASAGTQTSPVRPVPVASFQSPTKPINIASVAQLMSGTTSVSPSNITVGQLLSPLRGQQGAAAVIPLSPPIPSFRITSTPSPAKTPLRAQIGTPLPQTPGGPTGPRKTGSLALFYRKVYQLAYIRIKDLCERLGISQDILQMAWTCFEHTMMKSPEILRDRHIDQLIMCCIYVLSKVLRLEVTFQEIMRQYRHQPQAKSHVYRSVLLNNGPRKKPQPDTSSPSLGASRVGESDQSEPQQSPVDHILYRTDIPVFSRGDIIQFYNKIFIGFVKDYALKFTPDAEAAPSLSPLPVIRKTTPSPRKLSKHHQIFVSPHKAGNPFQRSPLAMKYIVQKSPASQLHEMNEALKAEGPKAGAKRQLDLTASPHVSSPAKRAHIQVTRPQGTTPGRRPTNSLMQQLMSIASDRANFQSQSATSTSK